ncbi:Sensor histidine kinase LiaS [compost metagenome]
MKDGLCEVVCSGIAQDSRGFYWISTQGGINRFDGTNFKSYFPSELLGEKQLLDNSKVFFESTPNRLLFTLGNSEAFVFNTVAQDLKPVKSLKNKVTIQFERIDKDRIVVFSVDTIFILNNQLEIVQNIVPPLKKTNYGLQLMMTGPSKCLINSLNESFWFDFKTKQFTPFHGDFPTDGLFNTGFELLYADPERQQLYFVNFFHGLLRTDYSGKLEHSWDLQELNTNLCGLPNRIIPDQNNRNAIWISGNKGVAQLNKVSLQTVYYWNDPQIPFSISDNLANNLYLDQHRNLWVSTFKGVSVLNRNASFIKSWDLKLNDGEMFLNTCRISGHELLITKYNHGIYHFNEQTNKITPYHEGQLGWSWFVFRDGPKVIHGGRGTDLQIIDLDSDKLTTATFLKKYFKDSELITMGFKDQAGNWWFSANSRGGLVRFDPKTGQAKHFSRGKGSFSGSYFTSYSETPDGDIWFSSNKTQVLTHWIRKEDRFEEVNFQHIFQKQHQSILLGLATDKKGNVWLGFEGGGLVRYSIASKKTTVFGKKQGIPSNYIYNLVFDDQDRLWIGTKKGLACLGPDLKTVKCFGAESGFPSEQFDQTSYFDPETRMLWVGSGAYLMRFSPDRLLKTEKSQLKVFMDEFLVSNRRQPIENRNDYYFSPSENTVQFVFSTINPSGKNRIEYSYLLEGTSGSWVSLGTNSSIIFPSLLSGAYEFHLRAKIPGTKSWVYLKDPIRFTIATPWYRSWWFRIVVIVLSAGIIFFVTRMYFLTKIEKQRAILERQRAVQNERDRIAYDMHDDLGSGLTKISYLSKEAVRKEENRSELDRINQTSLELVKNMSELIWAMKVENDSLADLMSYLRHYAMEYFETNQIEIQMESGGFSEDQQISGEIRRQVFLIFKEALHNIVKHAQTNRVLIQIHVNDKLTIRIRDFGRGFKAEEGTKRSGNGMKTMQERTKRLHGTMQLTNSEEGVELFFEIPFEAEQK